MTKEPENYENFGPGIADVAGYMYGVEYGPNVPSSTTHLLNHNVPCAVCYVATRETVLMVPGRYTCLPNWTREYHGKLLLDVKVIEMELVSIMWSHVVVVCLALHMTNRKG